MKQTMKLFSLFATLAILAMGVLASASTAATKTPFTFSGNVAEFYGEVSCTGVRTVSKTYPNGRDKETCVATGETGKFNPETMVAGKNQEEFKKVGGGGVVGWNSDYDGKLATSYHYNVPKNLKKFTLVAVY
jgi:hypothetical protein